jgi:autotransporter passenger strand-loop-strand repeat protein
LAGATEILGSGVTSTGVIIGSGVRLILNSNASAFGTQLSSGLLDITSDRYASGTQIGSGSFEVVYAGGSASGSVVSSGGAQVYAGGSFVNPKTQPGAFIWVISGAAVSGLEISSGISLVVSSGGSAVQPVVNSGGMLVYAGGIVTSSTLQPGAVQYVASGVTSSGWAITSGMLLGVGSGAQVVGAQVSSGGILAGLGGNITSGVISAGGTIRCYVKSSRAAAPSKVANIDQLQATEMGEQQAIAMQAEDELDDDDADEMREQQANALQAEDEVDNADADSTVVNVDDQEWNFEANGEIGLNFAGELAGAGGGPAAATAVTGPIVGALATGQAILDIDQVIGSASVSAVVSSGGAAGIVGGIWVNGGFVTSNTTGQVIQGTVTTVSTGVISSGNSLLKA